MRRWRTPIAWIAAAVVFTGGCDSGSTMGKVKGVVRYGGVPVTEGTVQFFPVQPGPMSAGRIGEGGNFELVTKQPGDGALVGQHVVVVVPPNDVERLEREMKPGQALRSQFKDIPQAVRSQNSSPLTVEVKSGSNDFQIDLKEMTVGGERP